MTQGAIAVKPYFSALTGVRAIAAYLVFFFHYNLFPTDGRLKLLRLVVEQWHIGVSIFFVLSGFLIAIRYMNRVELSAAWAKQYMFNRFARIYPIYFLLTVLTFIVMAVQQSHRWYEWPAAYSPVDKVVSTLTNFTLTRAFFREFFTLGMPTAWSLTVEECFYISAPFLLLALRRRPTLLPLFALGLFGTGALLTLLSTSLQLYGSFMRPFSFVITYTYFGRCVEFLAGIGLALWLRKRDITVAKRGTTLLGLGLVAVCVAGMVAVAWDYQKTTIWPIAPLGLFINNAILPLGVVVLFHGLINEKTWFQRVLGNRVFDLLGKSSYVFYLIHMGLVQDTLKSLFGSNVLVHFIGFNLLAIFLYKLVEHPIHSALIGWFKRRKEEQPAVVAPAISR